MVEIPAIFDQPGAAFVLLPDGIKFPPIEKAWQNKGHSFTEARAHRGNVGIMAGNGYIGLDKDDPAAFDGLVLPPTTLWETRPGRLGMWLRCSDNVAEALAAIAKKADQAQLKLFKAGRSCGEVKLQRTYQVIPPSHKNIDPVTGDDAAPGKGDRVDYKLLDSSPPASISLAKLLADLQAIGITFSSKLEANAAKLEDIGKKANQTRIESDEVRTRRYAEAALRSEALIMAGTPAGGRNDQLNKSLFKMGQLIAAKVLTEAEVISELSRAAINAGLDPEEIRKTIMSGLEAGAQHPREIPDRTSSINGAGPKADLLERIKADPRALKDPAIMDALAVLKANDPIEYDLLLESIKKAGTGIKVATINETVDKCILESKKATEKPQETPEAIREKAQAIAGRGDPFKFLIWQGQRNHLGDIDMHKVLISSIASASSETSHGLQPGNNGDSGSGKDDACEAVYHLVPSDRKLDGSLSPMSLFYLEKDGLLKPGMVLYSDDVEYLPIIPIYKRSSARFQKYTNHYSVSSGKERTGLKMTIPPRMVWWMTSVESVANLEAFGRQYPISTDSSPGHKKRVTEEIAARRARTELKLTEDEGIEVARAIISDIFDNGPFKVLIPQSVKAKWLKVSDFRGQEQFWDLVDAQVVLHWRQRKKDENGWLIAEDQDLIEAKEIHTGHKVAHFSDLTEAEAKVIGVMSSGRSMTQKELTEALGTAQCTLSIRLKSIMAKSAIITEDYDQGKKVYSINPKMNLGTDYWNGLNLIELGIDDSNTYCSQLMLLLQSYCSVIGVPIGVIINNSNRIPSSLLLNMTESMRDICSQCCGKWSSEDSISSSSISAKTSNNNKNEQQEDLLHHNNQCNNGQSDCNKDISEPIGTTIRQAGDTEEQIRIAARMEWGYNGEVNPAIVAGKLQLSVDEVTTWLEAHYVRVEKPGGVVRYAQPKAGEEAPA